MVGRNIQLMREMRGLNKTELAKLANMSVGSLSHIEKGTRKPSLEMLYTIADALNVSIINLVIDEKEIERFYYDDLMKAYYPGSERLKEIIDRLIENGTVWENAERIAIVDISSKSKKK